MDDAAFSDLLQSIRESGALFREMTPACPACSGEAFFSFSVSPITGCYEEKQHHSHVCPTRAAAGDYTLCLCCKRCLKTATLCHSFGSISEPVTPAGSAESEST